MQTNTHPELAIFATNGIDPGFDLDCSKILFRTKVRQVEGVYKGESEPSFIVPLDGEYATLENVLGIANSFKQESVLFLDNQRSGWLHFCDGRKPEYLGTFKEISPETAKTLDAYTKDGAKYYACR